MWMQIRRKMDLLNPGKLTAKAWQEQDAASKRAQREKDSRLEVGQHAANFVRMKGSGKAVQGDTMG